ncbi:hypothetical protein QE364_000561 [Nocardioides zeae]|uniref:Uncharacterized protein n=1 Tax=Nocardioides zeae TaxID=1457234 RepID=A0ACC6IDY3_9ACTN|nr:hypothetical protein [Nocardioides zeae]MDR6174062.1 hypothetical protein [Nocardioides zeae]MDR6208869.1 hypothetical protein [Nocardioides zeae]
MTDQPRAPRLGRLTRLVPSRASLPGLAVGAAALVVAASSGAVAATMITGAQIADETVTTKDVKNGSLTGADVADATLSGVDVKNGSIYVSDLSASALKPLLRINGYEVLSASSSLETGEDDVLSLNCPDGKLALNASAYWNHSNEAIQILIGSDGTFALAYPENSSGAADEAVLQLTCATASY